MNVMKVLDVLNNANLVTNLIKLNNCHVNELCQDIFLLKHQHVCIVQF